MSETEKKEEANQAEAVSTSSASPEADSSKNILETLKKENLEMQQELEKRELMIAKRQELRAREILGGKSVVAPQVPQETPEQKARNARIKEIGMSTGAEWAKKM